MLLSQLPCNRALCLQGAWLQQSKAAVRETERGRLAASDPIVQPMPLLCGNVPRALAGGASEDMRIGLLGLSKNYKLVACYLN